MFKNIPVDKNLHSKSASSDYSFRLFIDRLINRSINVGGVSVIIIILLMFVYFIAITLPLFNSAGISDFAKYHSTGDSQPSILLSMDEQLEVGMRTTSKGNLYFFDLTSGVQLGHHSLTEGRIISSHQFLAGDSGTVILGLEDGSIEFIQPHYEINYIDDARSIEPSIITPYDSSDINFLETVEAVRLISAADNEERLLITTYSDNAGISLLIYEKSESLWGDSSEISGERHSIATSLAKPDFLFVDPGQVWLFIGSKNGQLELWNIRNIESPKLIHKVNILSPEGTPTGDRITEITLLTGGTSILASTESGKVMQWSPVRSDDNVFKLRNIRNIQAEHSPITTLLPEKLTKGFLSINQNQTLDLFHTTSERHLLNFSLQDGVITQAAISPRGDAILTENSKGDLRVMRLHNEHPEISFKALWGKIWYENHNKPKYLWQSSSAANDFEPKFSFIPLTFGTLKAAFYAMLVATPLALMGAIYTGYFLPKRTQGVIKPAIEIMEALPTVILGFLAGLWLAPIAETNLTGILSLFIFLPTGIFLFALAWHKLPLEFKARIPDHWQVFILIPVVALITFAAISLGPLLEQLFFNGDFKNWLDSQGIEYDQRNALIVGVAMGFAVIPTIFSITEDAVSSVPRGLTDGSLAMGASHWQTMQKIIIPTASPAIFSAIMIGFGRAIGETMIVLMATGNTPIMDTNIFEGMRTLSANLAVELPESEVGSTHFRILFLSTLIMFAFTFLLNTIAETVRQSLRSRFSKI